MVADVILLHFLEQGFEGLQLLIQIGARGLGHLGGVEARGEEVFSQVGGGDGHGGERPDNTVTT
jgi:hypothetical protein